MGYHAYDQETLAPDALVEYQARRLAALLAAVGETNGFYKDKFARAGVDLKGSVLGDLPLTTRAELEQDQAAHPPYGTNLTYAVSQYTRLHQTSGSSGAPLRWLDTAESWDWWKACWSVIYRAAGLSERDRLLFPFSFGPFIGFWAAFESAAALGNLCLPAGGMTTSARLRHLLDNEVTFVCCTPTYALRLIEVAGASGLELAASNVRGLVVAGEPGGNLPATRSRIEAGFGARVFDHAGMTEMGAWSFECTEAPGGMHVMEHEFIAEVIDPTTGKPAGEGEPGELVLTNLGRIGSPMIRYRTGDQVCLTRGRCVCGRWFSRIEGGILGRIDDMLVIRGNNVFPGAIEEIVRAFDEVVEFRIEVDNSTALTELRLRLEPVEDAGEKRATLAQRVAAAVQDRLHFRPLVVLEAPGSLPRFEMKARRLVRRESQ